MVTTMARKRGASDAAPTPDLPVRKKARFQADTASDGDFAALWHESTPRSPQSGLSTNPQSIAGTSITSRSSSKRPKRYACDYANCDKAFDRPVRLQAHIRTHTGERPFVCEEDDCDKSFFKPEHLKAHVQNKHSDDADFICTYTLSTNEEGEEMECGKAFTTATRLSRHVAVHEKAEELRCQEIGCGQVFRKMDTLQRHIKKEHLLEDSFRCTHTLNDSEEECGETLPTIGQLKSHETREHIGMEYFCEDCSSPDQPLGFPTYTAYQSHLKTIHPPTCTLCNKPCPSTRALAAHMEIEHSTLSSRQKFKCTYPDCDRGFTRKGNLNVHVQTVHVKNKKFVCGDFDLSGNEKCPGWVEESGCGLAFGTKANLEDHVRTQHLDLPSSIKRRRRVKIKAEEDTDTTPSSIMEFDEPPEFDGSNSQILPAGHHNNLLRSIACWTSGCAYRFSHDVDLAQHMELVHGWNVDDVHDYLAEKEALKGGNFWVGGEQLDTDGYVEDERDEALRVELTRALRLDGGIAGEDMFGGALKIEPATDRGPAVVAQDEDMVIDPSLLMGV